MSDTRISFRDAVFGQVVVLLRKQRDMEQGELAERAAMSRAALSRIERGDSSATINSMMDISKGLGIEFSELARSYERAERRLEVENVQIVPKAEVKSGSALALVGLAALAILLAKK